MAIPIADRPGTVLATAVVAWVITIGWTPLPAGTSPVSDGYGDGGFQPAESTSPPRAAGRFSGRWPRPA
jgi:hypothetical protein